MKDFVRELLISTFQECCKAGELTGGELPDFVVEVPRNKDHGDVAVNIAMVLAKQEKRAPREIAQILVSKIGDGKGLVEKTEIAGPGFINVYLKDAVWHTVLQKIDAQAEQFGAVDVGGGEKVLLEFVSANPTGPLHIGHGRGAALGDVLGRVLSFAGYRVDREYYINDVGNQMNNLGRAAWLRYKELLKQEVVFPDDLYQGAYLYDIAKDIILKHGKKFLDMAENEAVPFFTEYASTTILKGIQDDLASFGVTFDSWFSEKQLFDNGTVQRSLEAYREKKYAYEKDGALWFGTEKFGDEKDRVIIRDDGRTTYFASDISYHEDKLKRGYQHLIDIWGADHHGYVPRVRAALEALGLPHDAFNVILVQMVNLLREGVPVAMSTRAGEFVTLKEVIDEVGSDAARFLFLTRRSDAQLDFDLEVAKKQSDENPVYYVQYAHARICSIISVAAERGLALPAWEDVAVDRLSEPEDLDLVKQLSRFPETVAGSALAYEPHRIATFLMDLVGRFHSYYNKHRVITDDADLSRARLFLISSIRQVLRNGLQLLGVQAPNKM